MNVINRFLNYLEYRRIENYKASVSSEIILSLKKEDMKRLRNYLIKNIKNIELKDQDNTYNTLMYPKWFYKIGNIEIYPYRRYDLVIYNAEIIVKSVGILSSTKLAEEILSLLGNPNDTPIRNKLFENQKRCDEAKNEIKTILEQ